MAETESRTTLLFVISSLAIGGPQKSLIGLFQRLNPEQFDVSLLVLDPQRCELKFALPNHVTVLTTSPLVTAATVPRRRALRSMALLGLALVRKRRIRTLCELLWIIARSAGSGPARQRVRQHVWSKCQSVLPRIPGTFDAAFGILGQSTYAVVDLAQANAKYHWIRSDSRILNREHTIEASYFEKLQGAIAVSDTSGKIFAEMYPTVAGRIRTYKNDIPSLPNNKRHLWPLPEEDAFRLLTVARIDPLKGLDLLLDVAAELRSRRQRFTWVVLGEGPEREKLQEQVFERQLEDYVTFAGSVTDTASTLNKADIFVHPSRSEGRSNAVEEARAARKPIVATNYPTVADQVRDGVDGIVCEFRVDDLADAIERLIFSPEDRERYGTAAKIGYEAEREDTNFVFAELAGFDSLGAS